MMSWNMMHTVDRMSYELLIWKSMLHTVGAWQQGQEITSSTQSPRLLRLVMSDPVRATWTYAGREWRRTYCRRTSWPCSPRVFRRKLGRSDFEACSVQDNLLLGYAQPIPNGRKKFWWEKTGESYVPPGWAETPHVETRGAMTWGCRNFYLEDVLRSWKWLWHILFRCKIVNCGENLV